MAQSYLGKRAISKGIGRVIRKFVVFDFNVPLLDIGSVRATRTPGDTAAPWRRTTRNYRNSAVQLSSQRHAICLKTTSQSDGLQRCNEEGDGRLSPAWVREEGSPARSRPLWQADARGRTRPICLVQN
jgi:hypothetical protein